MINTSSFPFGPQVEQNKPIITKNTMPDETLPQAEEVKVAEPTVVETVEPVVDAPVTEEVAPTTEVAEPTVEETATSVEPEVVA